ncbi:MAG: DNA repair protein RecN [Armatimonadota bacterium]|jgi:DNA repair protein RecN (Recombination protein N)
MLLELSIENFALIDALTLQLGEGLCVLTGETGAGKSIVIDAIGAALGERVPSETIRTGEAAARVEAVFRAPDCERALSRVAEAGIDPGDDGTVILTRELSRAGRSRAWINGRPSTVSLLRAAGEHLVDVHGQHEHQALIREQSHIAFLDAFGGAEHGKRRKAYGDAYGRWAAMRSELQELQEGEREKFQTLDLLRFQVTEIDAAELRPGEEEELRAEARRLGNAERLGAMVQTARAALSGEGGEQASAVDCLGIAQQELAALSELDDALTGVRGSLDTAVVLAQDAAAELAVYVESIDADPGRIEQVEQRLDDLARLKRKYGDSVEDILALRDSAAAQIEAITSSEERIEELTALLEEQSAKLAAAGERLSSARTRLARRLERTMVAQLRELGMAKSLFEVWLQPLPAEDEDAVVSVSDGSRCGVDPRGLDAARFGFSANPGEEPKPLAKVASGGELSRLMLAFKSVCSRAAEIPTLIFDEIDSGIGADTAVGIGRKLSEVATKAQVLCVTHYPQIASMADVHLRVDKRVRGRRTVVSAEQLEGEERLAEVARMLGGTETGESTQEHAAEILAAAERTKAVATGK